MMILKIVISCVILSAAFVNFSQADTQVTKEDVVDNANEINVKCDIIPEVTNIEEYEESCVKKNVPVIVMKKNPRKGRIVNQDGKDRSYRPGPYRRRTTTPRTYYYKKQTTTPRTFYYIDRTDEYDDSDYYEDDEYEYEDEDDEYDGLIDFVLDIFF